VGQTTGVVTETNVLAEDVRAPDASGYEEEFWAGIVDDDAELLPGEEATPAPHDMLADITPDLSPEILEQERVKYAQSQPVFDLPMTTNDKVMFWVDYYANRNPKTFQKGLERSGQYLPMFRRIFAEAGLPRDLVFMAHVESGYKTTAYSRARAKGIFQFISATGRRYGLRIDYWVDERSDPEKSARASAAYMKDLYDEFGDYYLALAGYNAGEGRVRRAIRHSGTKDFWKISKTSRHLRRETRNYVPAILAATMISKDPAKYGFDVDYQDLLEYESVKVEGAADLRVLAKCAGSDFETLRRLNPALRRYQTPPGATTDVRVPVGAAEQTLLALADVPKNERVLYARHKVRTGETLSKLAGQYGVSVRAIQDTNRMGRSTMIRVGRTLVIPTVATRGYPGASPVGAVDVIEGEVVAYRVRRGDNLSRIARRYGTNSKSIAAASGIGVNSTLSIGQRLKVVPGVRSSSQARSIARGSSPKSSASGSTYIVRRGDSLWKIAQRSQTTVSRLCSLNGISSKATLHPGTKLRVR
jgi:membrane-bound lytic murein transglycosylase D